MKKLSVCTVNFNTPDLSIRCIDSILNHSNGVELECIIIDNVSHDSSWEQMNDHFCKNKNVILKRNANNRFFSGGFNSALEIIQGEYLLIINSDSFVKDNAIGVMVSFLDTHKEVGAIEGTTVNEKTGKITLTSSMELTVLREYVRSYKILKTIFRQIYNKYSYKGWNRTSDREVEVVCDAFLMVRTSLMREIGGFNEMLKLYFTEEYISDRIREKGFKLWHLGNTRAYHLWSSTTKKQNPVIIKSIYKTDRINYFALKVNRIVFFP